jgi:hypothetical protein
MKHLLLAVALLAALPSATALAQYSRGAPSYDEDDDDRPAPDRRDYAPRSDDRRSYDRPDYGDRRRPDMDQRSNDDRRRGDDRGRGSDQGGGGPVALFVGTVPNCNAALVSADPNLKGCPTRPIGSTAPSGAGARLYAGPSGVSNAPGGRFIGQLSANGRQELYVGLQRGCNQGVVTTNPRHANCPTQAIGWTR